jgi:hypothetical protein
VAFASIVLSLEKQCGGIYLETNGRAKMDEPKQDREMAMLNFCSWSDSIRIRYTVKKRLAVFPSPGGMSFTKLFLAGKN